MTRKPVPPEILERMQPTIRIQDHTGIRVIPKLEGEIMHSERVELQPMPQIQPLTQPQQGRQREIITGSHVDRANAFTIRTRNISLMSAFATALIWFLVRWALPMTSGDTASSVLIVGLFSILWALIAFFTVWLIAYVIDMLTSPGGIELFESWRTQSRIDRQSTAIVDAYRKAHGIEQ